MIEEIQRERSRLVETLRSLQISNLEGKYFLFYYKSGNYETDVYREWYPLYVVKNGSLEKVYDPTDYNFAYDIFPQGEDICLDVTMKFMKQNQIKTVFSLGGTDLSRSLGMSKFNEFLGVDLREYPYDDRLESALEWLKGKRKTTGCWHLENIHNGNVHFDLEERQKPSRFITLKALLIQKHFQQ